MTGRFVTSLVLSVFAVALGGTDASAAPDLIVINGDIYTVDPDAPRVQGFAVEDGKFSIV